MILTSKEASKKWTPGPWVRHPYNLRLGTLISFGELSRGENVAIVMAQTDPEEARANADLILAAPALYDALYAIAMDEGDGIDLMTNARAALYLARTPGGNENG